MRLNISMPPISIRRSPFLASRPVVSVSSTISRIAIFPRKTSAAPIAIEGFAAALLKLSDDRIDLVVAVFDRSARVHNEIGARPLFGFGKLPGDDGFKFGCRHAGARQYALALDVAVGAD